MMSGVGIGCEGFESEGNQPVVDEVEKGELVLECSGGRSNELEKWSLQQHSG